MSMNLKYRFATVTAGAFVSTLGLLAAGPAAAQAPKNSGISAPGTFRLPGIQPSDLPGEALVATKGGNLVVQLRTQHVTAQPSIAYVQHGHCADHTHSRAYSLQSVTDGRSSTQIRGVTADTLRKAPYSIVIARPGHPAAAMECGDVLGASPFSR